jgi:hypothetical protein
MVRCIIDNQPQHKALRLSQYAWTLSARMLAPHPCNIDSSRHMFDSSELHIQLAASSALWAPD